MGNFNRDRGGDRGGYKGNFNRRDSRDDSRGGFNRERPEMFKATCAECGKPCEVPFRPSGDKPVYCRDCFNKRDNGSDSGNYRDGGDRRERSYNRTSYNDKEMFSAVCDSCGKKCEVPFRPSGDKPVYCSDCFGHKEGERSERINPTGGAVNDSVVSELKAQINTINTKLDRVLRALELRGQIGPVEEIVIKTEPEMAPEVAIKSETKTPAKAVVAAKKPAVKKTAVKKPVAKKAKKAE